MLCACSTNPRIHKSSSEFSKEYENSRIAHTTHNYDYLGESDGNVYLSKKSRSIINQKKWHETIIVGNMADLDPGLQKELKALNKDYLVH